MAQVEETSSRDDELLDSDETPLSETSPSADASGLEDLFQDAVSNQPARKLRRAARSMDPGLREALDATAKKMRELYTNPNNWKAGRGLVLIDKETQTVLGNYRELLHTTVPGTRKLLRMHEPITIDGQEVIEGWLGHEKERELRGVIWDREVQVICHVTLDEIQVEAPLVELRVLLQFNSIVRADLTRATQFASGSGNVLLQLPAGTNIWLAACTDTKAALRLGVLEAASKEPIL